MILVSTKGTAIIEIRRQKHFTRFGIFVDLHAAFLKNETPHLLSIYIVHTYLGTEQKLA